VVFRVMRGGGGGGGSTTIIQAPNDPTIVRHRTVSQLTDLTSDSADPGDTILNEADGRVYRMKDGTTDSGEPDNWEVADYVLPRAFATEEARINRTGFTPSVGEIIHVNGTVAYYRAGATATDDEIVNIASSQGSDVSGSITRSSNRPDVGVSGLIHFRRLADGADPQRWDYANEGRWLNTGSGTVTLEPTGDTDFSVVASISDATESLQWFDADGNLLNEADFYTQDSADTATVTLYADSAQVVIGLEIRGCKTFSGDLLDLSELEVLDFENSGLEGSCPQLRGLGMLKTLNIKGNPNFTLDPSCIADNVGLTVEDD